MNATETRKLIEDNKQLIVLLENFLPVLDRLESQQIAPKPGAWGKFAGGIREVISQCTKMQAQLELPTERAEDEFQKNFDAIVSPKLRAAVERCAIKHNLVMAGPLEVEVTAIIMTAAMLELVEAGEMEICNFKNGKLIFIESDTSPPAPKD